MGGGLGLGLGGSAGLFLDWIGNSEERVSKSYRMVAGYDIDYIVVHDF